MVFSTSDPSQPFPSPGSAFIPPPVPGPHEFALPRPRRMSKRDMLDSDPASSNSNATVPTPSTHGVVDSPSQPSLPPCDPPHPPSDPQLSLPTSSHTHHRLSNQSVTSLTSSRPAPPSPAVSRRASGLSRTSRPASGMSTTLSPRPVSGAQHSRPVSGPGSRPASGTTPITTSPTTPTPTSLSHDRRPNSLSTSGLDPPPTEPTPTQPTTTTTASPNPAPAPIQIRDYGFAPTDLRFSGQGPHAPRANRPVFLARRLAPSSESTPTSLSEGDNDNDDDDENDDEEGDERMNVDVVQSMWEDVVDDGTNGWGEFKWGFGRAWAYGRMSGLASGIDTTPSGAVFPSRGDLDRNFGGEEEYEDMEIDEEGEAILDGEDEGEPPLFPGLYRALYAFEPEGTAEMKLDEDQLVRVVGRGGGVGWAVVVRDGLKDTGVHALVPESYLEPARLDGQEEDG
ncbi:hypothetical protein JVT61DRAFT_3530 [Boletus reticuloceps]|uniref:SH3 domain-containing protein n=1 Tax=Boletus reticuloceps TaxID=495285 RepID=A0A8I3AAA2_9AGAM|nr:hypothetical protein JVT61DRAFT_3530 [Boletus reticuloceps]